MKQTFELMEGNTVYMTYEAAQKAVFTLSNRRTWQKVEAMTWDELEDYLSQWTTVKIVEGENIEDFLESVSAVTGIPVFEFDEDNIVIGHF